MNNINNYGEYVPYKPMRNNFHIPKRNEEITPRNSQFGNVEYPKFPPLQNSFQLSERSVVSYPPPLQTDSPSNYYQGFGNIPRGNSNSNNKPFGSFGRPFNNFQPSGDTSGNRWGSNQNTQEKQFKWNKNKSFRNQNEPYPKKKKPAPYTPLKEICPDLDDATLPQELRSLLKLERCDLCALEHNSPQSAKLHYHSKNHAKKTVKWLLERAEKTGEPAHPRAKATAEPKTKADETDNDPKNFHCDACDLPLTGKLHAVSHYSGKSHQLVVMGKKPPSGKGYYGPDGKWIRTTEKSTFDPFGSSLQKPTEDSSTRYRCEMCSVVCTSKDQFEMHLAGQKHTKKLKLKQAETPKPEEVKPAPEPVEISAASESESYHCVPCGVYLNSAIQHHQHLSSQKHANKLKLFEETKK